MKVTIDLEQVLMAIVYIPIVLGFTGISLILLENGDIVLGTLFGAVAVLFWLPIYLAVKDAYNNRKA